MSTEKQVKAVQVRATRLGYYNGRKRRGETFTYTLSAGESKLPSWMEEFKPGMDNLPEQAGISEPPGAQTPANTDEALSQKYRDALTEKGVNFHPRLGLIKLRELAEGNGISLEDSGGGDNE